MNTLKLKKVQIRFEYVMVVSSDDSDSVVLQTKQANSTWREAADDITSNAVEMTITNITGVGDLPEQWEVGCLPYGGDNQATINEILNKEYPQ